MCAASDPDRLESYDFDLPSDRIALRPVEPRDAARLLVVRPGREPELRDRSVVDLPEELGAGDLLVVNDTEVIPARLFGWRLRAGQAARVEILLHRRLDGARWRAFARPTKRLRVGDALVFAAPSGPSTFTERGEDRDLISDMERNLKATLEDVGEGGEVTLVFGHAGPALDAALAEIGAMPLPPYIASIRAADARDARDYQTLFAKTPGAVAAPTAGLHFTPRLRDALTAKGIGLATLTLHVGAGTFLPVRGEAIEGHRMHAEMGVVAADAAAAINAARHAGGRIIAVGTTALRLLESAAREDGLIEPFAGETAIFIRPGYRFRAVDALMTNFHLPRSTLFMLVAAFSGLGRMQRVYAHAIGSGYRFYSYGDASLLWPEAPAQRPLRAAAP